MGAHYLADLGALVDARDRLLPPATTAVDRQLARRWWALAERLADQGQPALAAECFERAAPHGPDSWHYALGERYADGLGVPADSARAGYWLEVWASWKDKKPHHWHWLGERYAEGRGVPQNPERARFWLDRCTTDDIGRSDWWALGLRYADGIGLPADPDRAIYWLTAAAENGEESEQWELGLRYADGRGLPRDPERAAHWLDRGATSEGWRTVFDLSLRYATGDGVALDIERAIGLLRYAGQRAPFVNYHDTTPKDEIVAYIENRRAKIDTADARYSWLIGEFFIQCSQSSLETEVLRWFVIAAERGFCYDDANRETLQHFEPPAGGNRYYYWLALQRLANAVNETPKKGSSVAEDCLFTADKFKQGFLTGTPYGAQIPDEAVSRAKHWYLRALQANERERSLSYDQLEKVGLMFAQEGVYRDPDLADLAFTQFLAKRGWFSIVPRGLLVIARRYEEGDGVPQSLTKANAFRRKVPKSVAVRSFWDMWWFALLPLLIAPLAVVIEHFLPGLNADAGPLVVFGGGAFAVILAAQVALNRTLLSRIDSFAYRHWTYDGVPWWGRILSILGTLLFISLAWTAGVFIYIGPILLALSIVIAWGLLCLGSMMFMFSQADWYELFFPVFLFTFLAAIVGVAMKLATAATEALERCC